MHRRRIKLYGDPNTKNHYVRKYFFNEKLMDTWTKESAWILGWVLTDGYIYEKRSPHVVLTIKDYSVVDNIRKVFNDIRLPKERRAGLYTIMLNSRYLVNRFVELGVYQNKSLTVGLPQIPDEYFYHMLRGVLEGDGCLFVRKQKTGYQYLTMYFCSASKLLID